MLSKLELSENDDQLYNFFTELDDFNINVIKNNYNLWFDSNIDDDDLIILEKYV